VETFAGQRSRDGSVGADQPKVKAELLSHGKRESVTATSNQHDFNSSRMCTPQGFNIHWRDAELGVKQSAVYINGKKTDGESHRSNFSTGTSPECHHSNELALRH
jgi:hypothetical protein